MVFVNYRVQEQPGYATLLYRELSAQLGADAVFLASGSIRPGDDFVREVFDSLRQCEVVLAVMGPDWLDYHSAANGHGLGPGADWVRREIAEAFTLGIRVIPVLIEGAEMPSEEQLPPDIAALSRCQCLRLRHYSVESDLARLVDDLRRTAPSLAGSTDTAFPTHTGPMLFRSVQVPRPACRIGVVTGTIRRVRSADIWVNSENTDMEMARYTEFSISAIIRYWGAVRDGAGRIVHDLIAAELDARVGVDRPVAPGAVVVTGSGELAASNNVRHIVHVAAVTGEPGAGFRQVRNIGWCVTNVLVCCEQLANADPGVRTVLFPLLGAGMAGATVEPTVRAMVLAVLDHIAEHPATALRAVYLLASTEREYETVTRVLRTLPLVPTDDFGPEARDG